MLRNWQKKGSGPDKAQTLSKIQKLVGRFGWTNGGKAFAELDDGEKRVVNAMGGWQHICGMTPDKMRITYYQALKAGAHV